MMAVDEGEGGRQRLMRSMVPYVLRSCTDVSRPAHGRHAAGAWPAARGRLQGELITSITCVMSIGPKASVSVCEAMNWRISNDALGPIARPLALVASSSFFC